MEAPTIKATRGGFRLGSGRKRGTASIKAEEARKYLIDRVVSELEPILAGQIELAKGMFYEVEEEGGIKRIYTKLPDSRVATYLLNQLVGRAKETVDLNIKPPFSLKALAERANRLEAEFLS